MNTTDLQNKARLIADRAGARLWRNNSGVLLDRTGRPVRYGLANESKRLNDVYKSSDLIGMMPDGRFLALEFKPAGWTDARTDHDRAQLNFIEDVRRCGGVGYFVTSLEQVEWVFK
jgi:hypothetical protein